MNGDPISSIPRNPSSSRSVTGQSDLRSKNKKRDDQIRRKVEQELSKRASSRRKTSVTAKEKKGTVSSLKPNPAIIILETAKILQAAQLMAAKRTDAVLVVSEHGDLVGILTDKDICFRVVAQELDVSNTCVSQVMTPDPIAVYDKGNRNEALNIMVSRRFRHLPVISDGIDGEPGTSVVGLLDITKCVFERLDDLERKVTEDQSIINAMDVLEKRGTVHVDRIDTLRNEHGCPTVSSILFKNKDQPDAIFPSVSVKSSVRDAAKAMKAYHGTAVLVTGTPDGEEKVAGIFTTKDIVLRVIAAALDPNVTSVIRVMTPHPDFVSSDSSILDALKKLHAGHFLHLPVIDNTVPVGLIDVMTLTITMLNYLVSKSGLAVELGTEEGPLWNSFWNSTFTSHQTLLEEDNISVESDPKSSNYNMDRSPQSLMRNTSSVLSPEPSLNSPSLRGSRFFGDDTKSKYSTLIDGQFSFKLRDMTVKNGKIYRFSSKIDSLQHLYDHITAKTGYTNENLEALDFVTPDGTSARLCYVDDEGDIVAIENDKDLQEACQLCIDLKQTKLAIYLGEPEKESKRSMSRSSSVEKRSATPVAPSSSCNQQIDLMEQLKNNPMPVNVAISAGIVVVAFYVMTRIAKSNW